MFEGGEFSMKKPKRVLSCSRKKVTEALILKLPEFNKLFEVDCDTSSIGIGAVLNQKG